MAGVPNGVETLPNQSPEYTIGCTDVTDRQTTDGRTTTYSEREREFTFAKNHADSYLLGQTQRERRMDIIMHLFTITASDRCVVGLSYYKRQINHSLKQLSKNLFKEIEE